MLTGTGVTFVSEVVSAQQCETSPERQKFWTVDVAVWLRLSETGPCILSNRPTIPVGPTQDGRPRRLMDAF